MFLSFSLCCCLKLFKVVVRMPAGGPFYSVKSVFHDALTSHTIFRSTFGSGVARCIGKCALSPLSQHVDHAPVVCKPWRCPLPLCARTHFFEESCYIGRWQATLFETDSEGSEEMFAKISYSLYQGYSYLLFQTGRFFTSAPCSY